MSEIIGLYGKHRVSLQHASGIPDFMSSLLIMISDNFSCCFIFKNNDDGWKTIKQYENRIKTMFCAEEIIISNWGILRDLLDPNDRIYVLSVKDFLFNIFRPVVSDTFSNAICPYCGGPGLKMFNHIDCFNECDGWK